MIGWYWEYNGDTKICQRYWAQLPKIEWFLPSLKWQKRDLKKRKGKEIPSVPICEVVMFIPSISLKLPNVSAAIEGRSKIVKLSFCFLSMSNTRKNYPHPSQINIGFLNPISSQNNVLSGDGEVCRTAWRCYC